MPHTFDKEALSRFQYWINERIAIHDRRARGASKPWTGDKIMQEWFFTNPYREWDRVTIWFRENMRDPLQRTRHVLMATIIFRWFNRPDPTGELLKRHNLHVEWDKEKAAKLIIQKQMEGEKVFTSAFIISAGAPSKVRGVCDAIQPIWEDRDELYDSIVNAGTLQYAHERLSSYRWMGKFMAYEVVTDLRHTHMLKEASDIMTWCNPGPGCKRGYWRVKGYGPSPSSISMEGMQELLKYCPIGFEMRDLEHSLCEFDKYERIRDGGRGKRKYNGR